MKVLTGTLHANNKYLEIARAIMRFLWLSYFDKHRCTKQGMLKSKKSCKRAICMAVLSAQHFPQSTKTFKWEITLLMLDAN